MAKNKFTILDMEQGTEAWNDARMMCVTGTKNARATGSPEAQRGLIAELIAEEMSGQRKAQISSPAIERGNAEEIFSIKEFEKNNNKKVDQVGFIRSSEKWYGLSPDGIIYKDGVITEAYETKCPDTKNRILYQIENEIPMSETGLLSSFTRKDELYDALDQMGIDYDPKGTMKELELLLPSDKRGKPGAKAPWHGIPAVYKNQCLHYFVTINTLETLYFGVYDSRILDEAKKLYVVKVERKDVQKDIEENKKALDLFREKWWKWREIINPSNF